MSRTRILLQAVLVVGALAAPLLAAAPPPGRPAPSASRTAAPAEIDWDRTLENAERIVTILGLLLGGAFAYFKFFRGRVFVPRLETDLSGRVSTAGANLLLAVNVKVKNVGLSRVDLHQKGTALRLSVLRTLPFQAAAAAAPWEKERAFVVFQDHGWIESGETIRDEILILLPATACHSFRLELRLVGSLHRDAFTADEDETRFTWRAICIVNPPQSGGETP